VTDSQPSTPALAAPTAPWFVRLRPAAALAALLFVGILVLRLLSNGADDGLPALYVLPISLVAMAYGRRAGVVAGIVGATLVVVGVLAKDLDPSWIGWTARILPLLVVGAVLGNAADRLAQMAEHRRLHDLAVLRHQQAVEINDTLVQGMAVAKWSLEAGRIDSAAATLDDTIRIGHQLVSGLIREAEIRPTDDAMKRSGGPPSE
jgi:hypothetical protein